MDRCTVKRDADKRVADIPTQGKLTKHGICLMKKQASSLYQVHSVAVDYFFHLNEIAARAGFQRSATVFKWGQCNTKELRMYV